jgi:hypothetical protein
MKNGNPSFMKTLNHDRMKNMEYTTEDLCRAYDRAVKRGPEAAARFREALNRASYRYLKLGESFESAIFELFADDPKGKTN